MVVSRKKGTKNLRSEALREGLRAGFSVAEFRVNGWVGGLLDPVGYDPDIAIAFLFPVVDALDQFSGTIFLVVRPKQQ